MKEAKYQSISLPHMDVKGRVVNGTHYITFHPVDICPSRSGIVKLAKHHKRFEESHKPDSLLKADISRKRKATTQRRGVRGGFTFDLSSNNRSKSSRHSFHQYHKLMMAAPKKPTRPILTQPKRPETEEVVVCQSNAARSGDRQPWRLRLPMSKDNVPEKMTRNQSNFQPFG